MGAPAFNVGDVVKIVKHPFGTSKKVEKLGGAAGVVVDRYRSGMASVYVVEVDGVKYKVTNAKNLTGPHPKEVLTNSNYKIPKSTLPYNYYFNSSGIVVKIVGVSEVAAEDSYGNAIKLSRFKNYTPIPKEYEKYIIHKHGEYFGIIAVLLTYCNTKKILPIIKWLRVFDENITVEKLKNIIKQGGGDVTDNVRISINKHNNSIIYIETSFTKDGEYAIMFEIESNRLKTRVYPPPLVKTLYYMDHPIINKFLYNVKKMLANDDIFTDDEIINKLGSYDVEQLVPDYEAVFHTDDIYIRTHSYDTIAITEIDLHNMKVDSEIRDKKHYNTYKFMAEKLGDLRGVLNL